MPSGGVHPATASVRDGPTGRGMAGDVALVEERLKLVHNNVQRRDRILLHHPVSIEHLFLEPKWLRRACFSWFGVYILFDPDSVWFPTKFASGVQHRG